MPSQPAQIKPTQIAMLSLLAESSNGEWNVNGVTYNTAPQRIIVENTHFQLQHTESTDNNCQWWHYHQINP